jgi:hypothetical protein
LASAQKRTDQCEYDLTKPVSVLAAIEHFDPSAVAPGQIQEPTSDPIVKAL